MTSPKQPPPDADGGEDPDERSALGKFMHGCMMVAVTALVAVFLVFGLCVIALRNM